MKKKIAKRYEFTTGLMHAELNFNIINYRLVKCGLESYWWIDGAIYLHSALDWSLLEAFTREFAMTDATPNKLEIAKLNIAEPLKKQNPNEVFYSFFYDHDDEATQGAKWPSLSEAIKHVNLNYELAGIASNISHANKPVNIKIRLVEDSTDFIKMYFNGELMFAEEESSKIDPLIQCISDFFNADFEVIESDGVTTYKMERVS